MMSLGNDFVSGPITAKGVSVAIRSYPKKLQKIERCTSVSVQLSEGLGWARMGVPPRRVVCPRRGYVSVSVQTDDYKSSITQQESDWDPRILASVRSSLCNHQSVCLVPCAVRCGRVCRGCRAR